MGRNWFNPQLLLDVKDINDQPPEMAFSVGNRSIGKTVGWTKKLLDDYFAFGHKFELYCRLKNAVGTKANGNLDETLRLFYPGFTVKSKVAQSHSFADIIIVDPEGESKLLGHTLSLKGVGDIKGQSSLGDTVQGYWDEFMPLSLSETWSGEVADFLNIHTTISRGGGESRTFHPTYFSSNQQSMAAPIFRELAAYNPVGDKDPVSFSRVLMGSPRMKRHRGVGFVYQNFFNEEIAEEHDQSSMSRAFFRLSDANFMERGWANDDLIGIGKASKDWGPSDYVATLVAGKDSYALRTYPQAGFLYIGNNVDKTSSMIYRLTLDGAPNLVYLRTHYTSDWIRSAIDQGIMRYEDSVCKLAAMEFMV